MADFLKEIVEQRRQDARRARRRVSEATLREAARRRVHRSLAQELTKRSGNAIVAEMKKASPSAGLLRPVYSPARLARAYEQAGAAGLSVLSEPRHFLGRAAHVRSARAASALPVLRKDFLCDPYQVAEAAAWGADVVLLIVAALDEAEMRDLYEAALDLGLEVLAEAHSEAELERALGLERAIVGVNSRNLKTLTTDLATACAMASRIPRGRLSMAESGIRTRADIEKLALLGYDGFLVGETLLRAKRPEAVLRQLTGQAGVPHAARLQKS
jgi:indole-3-glycerol phosphate synthase